MLLSKNSVVVISGALGIVAVVALYFLGPLPQDPCYHHFADTRGVQTFPNVMDVVSNLPFMMIGFFGAGWLINSKVSWKKKGKYGLLFAGILLTGLGSAYYHWGPENDTLLWDRLPMTIIFTVFFAIFLSDTIGKEAGKIALMVLLPLGIASVCYWYLTEVSGLGDLRPYIMVQYFPMVLIPLLLLYKRPFYMRELVFILVLYMLAKVMEVYDKAVFDMLEWVSGHTLKHLFSAAATWVMFLIVKKKMEIGRL